MTEFSRRGLFGLFAGAAASAVLPKTPDLMLGGVPIFYDVPKTTITMEEIVSITRKAFVPRLAKQIYRESPLISMVIAKSRGEAHGISPDGLRTVTFDWADYGDGA